MPREYRMTRRQDQVDATRRRIAKATYELHATIGPALTTIAMVAEQAGLPRQTVYRNFGTQTELFQRCVAYGLELHPLPDPDDWLRVADPRERLECGLAALYRWFEATEDVMTNAMRDFGAVREAAEASMGPVFAAFARTNEVLREGLRGPRAGQLLALAIDFATWKKLRRESGTASPAIIQMWADLLACGGDESV